MFNLFKSTEEDQRDRARIAYEKAVSLTTDSRDGRSVRMRIGLLSRAHLDKTFIDGARQAEAYEAACTLAVVQGKPRPDPPTVSLFQAIGSSAGSVWAYLPPEYAEEAYALGSLYQRTSISAEQAIAAVQALADRLCQVELKLDEPFVALQFLRDELASDGG